MNYIISEEKVNEVDKFCQSEGMDFGLRDLTPVQSGDVVSKEMIDAVVLPIWYDDDRKDKPYRITEGVFALQLSTPTVQPEIPSIVELADFLDRSTNLARVSCFTVAEELHSLLVQRQGKPHA